MVNWPKDDIVSIPLHDPIYADSQMEEYRGMAGIIYKDARLLMHSFQANEETILELLPEELSPGALGLMVALVVEYPHTSLGPYRESALFVECQYKDTVGLHTAYMYIDQLHGDHTLGADKALIVGRELLGFPKTLADISLSVEGTNYTGITRRKGAEIMRVEASVDQPGDFPDFGTMINVRALPSPDLDGYSYRDICTTDLVYQPKITMMGEGNVIFPPSHAAIHRVKVKQNLASFYVVADLCIPRGRVLDVIK